MDDTLTAEWTAPRFQRWCPPNRIFDRHRHHFADIGFLLGAHIVRRCPYQFHDRQRQTCNELLYIVEYEATPDVFTAQVRLEEARAIKARALDPVQALRYLRIEHPPGTGTPARTPSVMPAPETRRAKPR